MSDSIHRRPYYFSGCMSPSCVPVHEQYSRGAHASSGGGGEKSHRSRKLRKLLRKIVSESKSIYGSAAARHRHLNFQYDAVSYSQNFDDGYHRDDECGRRCQYVSDQDFIWPQHFVHKK
ncbi:hypothetical protein ABFS82_08G064800 [Erythranthe guttata]